ncbi:MAG: ROK family protein [Candidatus Dadabacteria bacterium]|nr:ROK family protein [Candidatus Dadabacteria bacterium]MCY4262075.1 ROK family protein [Candidatus Dadabacteria bacterium]
MKRRFLGIDIGGTNLRGKIITEQGDSLDEKKIPSEANMGIFRLMENLAGFIKNFTAEKISAVGIAIPGIVDTKRGTLVQAPNIANTKNFPFTEALFERIGGAIPLFIENDAACAALGEYRVGAGRGTNSMVMITLGTGFGGGIILDGKLWRGENGFAGELGHMTINPSGHLCNSGSRGCVEAYVSQVAIKRIVRENQELREKLSGTEESALPERLAELARKKDRAAISIWNDFGSNLGVAISILVNVLDVKTVVVGGGLSGAWELFIGKALEETEKRCIGAEARGLQIQRAVLGDDAGVLGACYIAEIGLVERF